MKRHAFILLMAACAPVVAEGELTTITVSSGGVIGQSTTIRSDDLVGEHFTGMGRPDSQRRVPGAFRRALAVIEDEGPATAAKVKPDGAVCADYGTDVVRIEPALADFGMIMDDCPNVALQAFMMDVLAAVDP